MGGVFQSSQTIFILFLEFKGLEVKFKNWKIRKDLLGVIAEAEKQSRKIEESQEIEIQQWKADPKYGSIKINMKESQEIEIYLERFGTTNRWVYL
jgi:hypothetical protein